MIGIYKITSPTGRIYIGQSIDIERRRKMYVNNHCKKQQKLYASLCKYGFSEHDFEVIEECEWDLLNEREEYWIEFYGTFNSDLGLNLSSGGLNKRVSEETKLKISKGNTGNKRPDLSIRNKEERKQISEETRLKLSISSTGKRHTKETKEKISNKAKERGKRPLWHSKKISEGSKGKIITPEHKKNMLEARAKSNKTGKTVINKVTGEEFKNLTFLCNEKGLCYGTMKRKMRGASKNNTDYEYLLT